LPLLSRLLSRFGFWVTVFFAALLITGCAYKKPANAKNETQSEGWSGRISLQIQSDPIQAFFTGFELRGRAEAGELTLISPMGSVLGVMRWSPDEAVMIANGETQRFESIDALMIKITGAALPVNALFDWLNGENTSLNGWSADLSQQKNGRITAKRLNPLPQAELRIVLDE
jgi:outer membrane lipoprotein LolB